ncbi:Crp/Fnr family transcriptional regulator [Mahella sp.]|uniref:Crp/Fnr family transcriptional regulator n=1 Tax=Mahella sp. TaxID=2798721 RepID=UPI0025BA4A90|nr:Crp/Fnr family transcriptional regulator [Mahella sp.]MBZ4665130.1 transcriptional regulator, Crp/Fnr family [Mahella sp.]
MISSLNIKSPLFEGIGDDDLDSMLCCIGANIASFARGANIVCTGDEISNIGVVLSGEVHVSKDDVFGRRQIMANLKPGDTFSEVFVCSGIEESPVTVTAATNADILFIDYASSIKRCTKSCTFHTKLIENMLSILAQKNIALSTKIDYLSTKSLRSRIAAYLLNESRKQASDLFCIPFSRNGLAEYLGADRSALSRELSRMKADGLIEYWKNSFKIIDKDGLRRV